jgi:NADPH:quinone reductase-like Zn-dependent oxidoreductase
MAAAVRALFPAGVDALVEAGLLGDDAAVLVRDGGAIASVRNAQQFATPGRRISHVGVMEQIRNTAWLARLADQAGRGVLTPRVARTLPMTQAADAHRIVERGGLRGRAVLTF